MTGVMTLVAIALWVLLLSWIGLGWQPNCWTPYDGYFGCAGPDDER